MYENLQHPVVTSLYSAKKEKVGVDIPPRNHPNPLIPCAKCKSVCDNSLQRTLQEDLGKKTRILVGLLYPP